MKRPATAHSSFYQRTDEGDDGLVVGKGTLFTVQKALPLMSDGGSIILTGSATGIKGPPALSIYSATKAAIRILEQAGV